MPLPPIAILSLGACTTAAPQQTVIREVPARKKGLGDMRVTALVKYVEGLQAK